MALDNTVTVAGNMTRDAELRYTNTGTPVANFGLAVNNRRWNKSTESYDEEASFFDVTCWYELAENVAESIQKGDRIVVAGRLNQDTWEKDGEKKSKVEIVADDVAPSLKWGTTTFSKREKGERQASARGSSSRGSSSRGSAPAAPEYDDTEPFIVDAGIWSPEMGIGEYPERMLP